MITFCRFSPNITNIAGPSGRWRVVKNYEVMFVYGNVGIIDGMLWIRTVKEHHVGTFINPKEAVFKRSGI